MKVELTSACLELFYALPGNMLLLESNAPQFTIIAATDDYCKTVNRDRKELIGKDLFTAYPDRSGNTELIPGSDLRASIEHAFVHKEIHQLPKFTSKENTSTGLRHWSASSKPVVNESGEVLFIIHSVVDVTTEVKAKQQAQSFEGFKSAYNVFMNAPVIIGILKGEDYVIEFANEGLLEVWGRTAEVVGKPLMQAIPELQEQGFLALLDRVCVTGEPFYAYEFPIKLNRHNKEEVLYFDFVYKPVYDNGTQIKASGIISVGHDVTAQVLARQKVQESEAKYHTLFESMDQGFCVLEMIFDLNNQPVDYRFVEINPLFEKQTGLKNAVGKTALELVPDLEPHWIDVYGKVASTGEAIRFVEGSKAMGRWFDVSAFRMGDHNNRKVALLFTDITERRKNEEALVQSERNLRNTILQAPVAMSILKGPRFVVDIANDRMYELWGRGEREILGKSIFDALPEVRNQGYEELLTGVFTTGERFAAYGIPVTLPRNDSIKTVYINLLYEAFREADGVISGVMAVAIDVTEQVLAKQRIEEVVAERTKELALANEALLHSNQELARSNQNLEEFAYAASHDLKAPVRKIQAFSERLKENLQNKLEDQDKMFFDRILTATERMNTLVDDLLMYSHVSRGTVTDELIDLNQKIRRVLDDLELEIQEKNATVTVDQLPTIKGHRRQLQQLFQNLISNAIKYHKPGIPPIINITCRTVDSREEALPITKQTPGHLYYLLEIKDNGIGFDPEDAERIFNVFTRLHGNAEYTGTGVGLSIARKVVENHGGYIWAESKPGEGATFKMLLPAV